MRSATRRLLSCSPSGYSMEPTAAECVSLLTLVDVVSWAGISAEDTEHLAALLDMPIDAFTAAHPRTIAGIPDSLWNSKLADWEVAGMPAGLRLVGAAVAMMSAARTVCRPQQLAPAPGPAGPTQEQINAAFVAIASGSLAAKPRAARHVKMSSVLDPSDEAEIPPASADQMTAWFDNYRALKHGDPMPDREPTSDQLVAMSTRVIELGMEPYADFSVLTPHGRCMAKLLRHRSWLPQEDGSYKPIEVPGPGSFRLWESCWRVYEVIMLMLRLEDPFSKAPLLVVKPSSLEAYFEDFKELVQDHPESWHLCQAAEDRCRAEHMPRIARRLQRELGRVATWSEVFESAAKDDRYWDREVRRPANGWVTRGIPMLSLTMRQEFDMGLTLSGRRPAQAMAFDEDAKGKQAAQKDGKRQKRDNGDGRGRQKGQGKGAQHPPVPAQGALASKGGKGGHPRRDKNGKALTDTNGDSVCFAFANKGSKGCPSPCANGRVHVCQKCLGPHQNSGCK